MRRIAFLFLLTLELCWAATGDTVDLTCPVCQSTVQAVVVTSYDDEAGVGRDLMEWSRAGSPLYLQPITCPACSFSARRASSFGGAVPYAVLQKLEARRLPEHTPIQPNSESRLRYGQGLESSQTVPVWIRLMLTAQQKEWEAVAAAERANAWMEVAWAIRLEQNPFDELLKKVPDSDFLPLFARLEDPESNQAVEEVELAREMLQNLSQGEEQSWRDLVLAGFMLRRHGEFAELEARLSLIESRLGADLRADLEASIALERQYLARALEVVDGEMLGRAAEGTPPQPILLYLSGELRRRLGRPEPAREQYLKALADPELPERMRPWAQEQLKLVEKEKGS